LGRRFSGSVRHGYGAAGHYQLNASKQSAIGEPIG
jgi:hypothetical protein